MFKIVLYCVQCVAFKNLLFILMKIIIILIHSLYLFLAYAWRPFLTFCHYLSRFVLYLFTDSPGSTLTVTPDSPVFTGETVNLKCVIISDHSDWRYEWYKDSSKVSKSYAVKENTLTIKRSRSSDAGQYTCKGHIDRRSVSSQTSSAVHISVTGELNIIILLNKPI